MGVVCHFLLYLHGLTFFWFSQLIFSDSSVMPPFSIPLPTVNVRKGLVPVFPIPLLSPASNNTTKLINPKLPNCSLSSRFFLSFIHLLIQHIFLLSTTFYGHTTNKRLNIRASFHIVCGLSGQSHIERIPIFYNKCCNNLGIIRAERHFALPGTCKSRKKSKRK